MTRDLTKTRSRGEPAVRQFRGPGMNKGLKKPRHGKFANPDSESSSGASKSSGAVSRAPGASHNDYSKSGPLYIGANVWRTP